MHDFVDKELGKAVPYGVYDIAADAGCVSVGIGNDTAQFAVNSIRRWLNVMGYERYPAMNQFMLPADGGGSHRSLVTLFQLQLQHPADDTRLTPPRRRPRARDAGRPSVSWGGWTWPGAPARTMSGAQPTALLTTHGNQVAKASLTTSPQVSGKSLGRVRQSASP